MIWSYFQKRYEKGVSFDTPKTLFQSFFKTNHPQRYSPHCWHIHPKMVLYYNHSLPFHLFVNAHNMVLTGAKADSCGMLNGVDAMLFVNTVK